MPAIADVLPTARLAAAKKHANSNEFKQTVKTTVADLRSFVSDRRVNQEVAPAVWGSYGKDSLAMWLLCELADIEYEPCFIYNELELPQHYTFVDEFDTWLGAGPAQTYYTEYRGIDYLDMALYVAKQDRLAAAAKRKTPDKRPPISFFDPQEAYDIFYNAVIGDFHWEQIGEDRDTLQIWSTRASEGMGRQWELSKNGKFYQPGFCKKKGAIPMWRALPIGDWSDLDVWAFLLTMAAPVSPIYGMNDIPQRGLGRNFWARTLWYCDPHVFSIQFVKWLKHYAPAQLAEVMERFPEVKAKLTQKAA